MTTLALQNPKIREYYKMYRNSYLDRKGNLRDKPLGHRESLWYALDDYRKYKDGKTHSLSDIVTTYENGESHCPEGQNLWSQSDWDRHNAANPGPDEVCNLNLLVREVLNIIDNCSDNEKYQMRKHFLILIDKINISHHLDEDITELMLKETKGYEGTKDKEVAVFLGYDLTSRDTYSVQYARMKGRFIDLLKSNNIGLQLAV